MASHILPVAPACMTGPSFPLWRFQGFRTLCVGALPSKMWILDPMYELSASAVLFCLLLIKICPCKRHIAETSLRLTGELKYYPSCESHRLPWQLQLVHGSHGQAVANCLAPACCSSCMSEPLLKEACGATNLVISQPQRQLNSESEGAEILIQSSRAKGLGFLRWKV